MLQNDICNTGTHDIGGHSQAKETHVAYVAVIKEVYKKDMQGKVRATSFGKDKRVPSNLDLNLQMINNRASYMDFYSSNSEQ